MPNSASSPHASMSASPTRDSGPEASASATDLAEAGRLVAEGIREFAKSILHGDKAHKDWLLAAAERFIAGKKPKKPPRLTPDQIVAEYAPQSACPKWTGDRGASGFARLPRCAPP